MKKVIRIVIVLVILIALYFGKNYYANMLLKQGEDNYNNGNYQIAKSKVDRAIYFNRGLMRAYLVRAQIVTHEAKLKYTNNELLDYSDKRNIRDAISDYSRCIERNERDTAALFGRARRYTMLGEYAEAENDYSRIIKYCPEQSTAHYGRAWIHERNGKLELALQEYTRSIALDTSGWGYNNRGMIYEKMGEYEKALADFDSAIVHKTNEWRPYQNKANILLKQRKHEEAVQLIKRAARLGSKWAKEWLTERMNTW